MPEPVVVPSDQTRVPANRTGAKRRGRSTGTAARSTAGDVIGWLREGDPAIRWQTMRDLTGATARAVTAERNKVGRAGWGARLLARQDRTGRWAATGKAGDTGLYTPKWISTTYTLLLLRDLGLP